MNTTAIKIKNLKHFNQIQTLLQIEDLEVFATEINFLYEKLEQYASEIDAAVKNSELMKAAINDYENERQYLMDKIAEMQRTTNIYVFDKEDEYNDIQIQQEQEQEQEQKQADIIDIFNNIYKQEQQEQEEKEQQEQKQESKEEKSIDIYKNDLMDERMTQEEKETLKTAREQAPSPIPELFSSLQDFIKHFSIYDKEHKKAMKKNIVKDFQQAGYKVKANNGYYDALKIILEVKKQDLIDNQNLEYLSEKAKLYYNIHTFSFLFNKEISMYEPENIKRLKDYIEVDNINQLEYNRICIDGKKRYNKNIKELFFKNEKIDKILIDAYNIMKNYSFLTYYDPYSDYNSYDYTMDYDFVIKLVD